MNTAFYNTTNEVNPQLDLFRKVAHTQDAKILALFVRYPDKEISATSILQNGTIDNGLITSIRRSLNTLTKQGHIQQLDKKVESLFGRPEFLYKLNQIISNG